MIQPLGHMLRVRPLPASPRSTVLQVPDADSTLRWVRVEAVGPLVRSVPPGCEALVSWQTAQLIGNEATDPALLPDAAVLLLRSEATP
jgi:hypothetical protein